MKNIFKVFSVMLIAGAVLASCTEPVSNVTPKYTITVTANNNDYGTVTGGGTYDSASTVTLTATANEGYKFVNWNDGNLENPRTITVTSDANYMANFAEADGMKVSFGTANWRATTILGADYSSMAGIVMREGYKDYDRDDTPHVSGYAGSAPGTYTHGQNDYYYFFYYENDNDITVDRDGSLSGQAGTELPNWQPKQGMTIRITAMDLNAHTVTGTVNGTLFHLPEYAATGEQVTNDLAIEIRNATWEDAEKSGKLTFAPQRLLVK